MLKRTALQNLSMVGQIKKQFQSGTISYDEAKAQLEPILEAIYLQQQVIAKRHGRRAYKLSVASILR